MIPEFYLIQQIPNLHISCLVFLYLQCGYPGAETCELCEETVAEL